MTAVITYRDSLDGIGLQMLEGFFEGWSRPHSPEKHLEILRKSSEFVLAFDEESRRVIGFVTALTDGVQAAFIPLLEVLPDYRGQGIGSELMRRTLQKLKGVPAIDLVCDEDLRPFYERLGMQPADAMIIRDY